MKAMCRIVLSFSFSLLFLNCSSSGSDPIEIQDDPGIISYEQVVSGIQNPWGMAFLPDGDILVTEKSGEIHVIREGKLLEEKIVGVPDVYKKGQGGLLDFVKHFLINQLHPT